MRVAKHELTPHRPQAASSKWPGSLEYNELPQVSRSGARRPRAAYRRLLRASDLGGIPEEPQSGILQTSLPIDADEVP